jgi:hypothetical protein
MKNMQHATLLDSISSSPIQTTITRYGPRYWAVYLDGKLLAVTVYKKGALAIKDALLFRRQEDNSLGSAA